MQNCIQIMLYPSDVRHVTYGKKLDLRHRYYGNNIFVDAQNARSILILLILLLLIVIIISKFLKRYSKTKRSSAPAYSRALRRIKWVFSKGGKRSSGPISRMPEGDS